MSKTFISYVFDGVSTAFMSFLIAYAISFFYLKNRLAAIAISICLSAATVSIYIIFAMRKRKKFFIKKTEENSFSSCKRALCLMEETKTISLIISALNKSGKQVVENDGNFVINEYVITCRFTVEPISADDILTIYKSLPSGKKLLFFGNEFSEKAQALPEFTDSQISIKGIDEVYKLLKDTDSLPAESALPKRKKNKIKTLLKGTFNKKKAGGFALYGSSLLLLSRFVFYPLWYILSGTLFLIYAITIKFFAASDNVKEYV